MCSFSHVCGSCSSECFNLLVRLPSPVSVAITANSHEHMIFTGSNVCGHPQLMQWTDSSQQVLLTPTLVPLHTQCPAPVRPWQAEVFCRNASDDFICSLHPGLWLVSSLGRSARVEWVWVFFLIPAHHSSQCIFPFGIIPENNEIAIDKICLGITTAFCQIISRSSNSVFPCWVRSV